MDDIKIREKYDNLMLWKVLFVFGNAIVLIIGFSFFGFFSLFITIPIVYISMMTFLAKNNCPWCNQPFFFFTEKGFENDGISFIFQTQCINCGQPHDI